MPTLNWIGKEKVINHHLDVPYRILDKQYSYNLESKDDIVSDNKIIHGDNLEALKSLLPEYEGTVDCIYIDPPYNTGNENWIYNDNVNHPKIKKWLGEIVGKESEDLTRHDKWLCMMYPRLKILNKLLDKNGVIFISIDDNEYSHLKIICDEIFGIKNFITNVVWRHSDNSNNNALKFSEDYNHTLVYSKNPDWKPNYLDDIEKRSHFKNPDNDPRGAWFDGNPVNNPGLRINLQFNLITPSGKIIKHPTNGWRWSRETIEEKLLTGELRFSDDETRLIRRTYLNEMDGLPPSNLWIDLEKTSHTRRAKYDLKAIFPEVVVTSLFPTPKPVKFIEHILKIATKKDSIILDSYAGSGTTAHAVLSLNKQDNGKRKFILVEMEDYANEITAERVKRVIKGYGESKKVIDGTGGDFTYYELGEPLFVEENVLNENLPLEKIKEYVWFTETKTKYIQQKEDYLLGNYGNTAYYFYYDKNSITTLDDSFLRKIRIKAEQYIIYADNCLLDENLMRKYNIVFKKIPRDITKF